MPTNSPYIVAEIGASHNRSLPVAYRLLDAAKDAGADGVKLQCWQQERMVINDRRISGSTWNGRSMQSLYAEAWTPWDWFPKLFRHAKDIEIECFSSVFDHESLSMLEELDCPRYKIASFEITDLPLIEAVARTGKPLVISTGMATLNEIADAVDAAESGGATSITLLKCTSAYPAPASEANLAAMNALCLFGGCGKGVSDHTLGIAVAVAATANGAHMIEKHLTLNRSDGGLDASFSSEPHEFKAMVEACREAAAAIGEVRYGPTEAELPSLQFRRSLYWAKDIAEGDIITREHLRTARPALGLPPKAMYDMIGKPASRAAKAFEPVTEQ